jgi:hypothetical protein
MPLKRERPRKRPWMSERTRATVFARQHGRCICGCGQPIASGPIGYHHIWPRQRWPELADDPANVVGVTADCHAKHESASRVLPCACVAVVTEGIVVDNQMRAYFERHYYL